MDFNFYLEFGLGALYITLILMGVYLKTKNKPQIEYKYLRYGLALKMFGGISFGLIYMFYYGYGDTFTYFESAKILSQILQDDLFYGLKLVFNMTDYVRAEDFLYNHFLVNYYRGDDTFTVVKIAGFLTALGAGGFFSTTVLFSCFAFFGQWKLYLVFINRYPHLKFELALAHFFIPSVIFWGSGIMKDSLVIGFLGILVYSFNKLFSIKKLSYKYIIAIIVTGYFIYVIKSYILFALVPALLFWFFFSFNSQIKSVVIKTVVIPLLLIMVSLTSLYAYNLLQSFDEKFKSEQLLKQATIYQTNHYTEIAIEGTRSGYTLGEYDQTITGLMSQILPAITVTLFRPFPWEIKNVVMALSSIESFVLTMFTLFVLFKMKTRRLLTYFGLDSFAVMCLVFTVLLAFIVGFSSYNFGALARYKIPCLPFYFSLLFLILGWQKNERLSKLKMP